MFQRIKSIPWLAQGISILGAMLFAVQTWGFIHTQRSVVDEGSYIYKGLLFVRGQYQIYQDYGTWSNHMPLSFIIPGAILDWFGPSMYTARVFAFVLGLLMLLGIWIVARRWGGDWWGAFAVWTMALNPAVLKIYSLMSSQVLIACMLAWMLVLILAKQRPLWHLVLGAVLSGVLLLTRLNLAPVLPLVILYIFWQHGKRAGVWATLIMIAVVILGHALFWPGILRMWATWVPSGLVPFLDGYRAPTGSAFWNPGADLEARLISFFWSIRYHIVATMGVLATILLWPRKAAWKSQGHLKASVFLITLFGALYMVHSYVTIGTGISTNTAYSTSYCTFCLPNYMGFFSFTGILLIVIAAPSWRKVLPFWLQALIGFLIVAIPTGIGFAAAETFGDELATWQFPAFTHRWLRKNTLRVWKYLNYYYALSYQQAKRVLPLGIGFLIGILTFIASGVLTILRRRKHSDNKVSFGYIALLTLLALGWLLAPTRMLGGGYRGYDCADCNVIAEYDNLGNRLNSVIPPGSLVYWQGEGSPAVLIYLEDIEIFPAQLNGKFSLFTGDSNALEKFGFWNQELAEKWQPEADYVLIGSLYYPDEGTESGSAIPAPDEWGLQDLSTDERFQRIEDVLFPLPGYEDEYILVYRRIGE
jgi:hypothetical protein